MIKFTKKPNEDFTVLNITDVQLGIEEWDNDNGKIAMGTILELADRVKPDLITSTGDFGWAHFATYERFGEFMEKIGLPWAVVWGNHDNMNGEENVDDLANRFMKYPHCIFEKGDKALGSGNYVILIEENNKPVEGMIMMDTHNVFPFTYENGETKDAWGKLLPNQIEWYKEQVENLQKIGCKESSAFMHIPPYVYRDAWTAAYDGKKDPMEIDAHETDCWNKGYENSFGVKHEDICCYPADEGFFDAVKQYNNHTKYVVVGHDHKNSFAIQYNGTWLIFSLKTGPGCYWESALNGGTVFKVSSEGIREFYHVYVDGEKFIKK